MFDHYRMREQLTRKIDLLKSFVIKLSKFNNFSLEDFNKNPEKVEEVEIITKTILLFIAKNFSKEEILYLSEFQNSPRIESLIFEDKTANIDLLEVVKQFICPTDVTGFIGTYYNINNGNVVYSDTIFNVDFSKSYEEIDKQILGEKRRADCTLNDIPLIITADGKCYLALGYHKYLSLWLKYNGVDMENAVRVRIFYNNEGSLHIEADESFKNLTLHNGEKKFVSLLTHAQTEKIIQIYNACIQNKKNFIDLEENLSSFKKVGGLGFDKFSIGIKKVVKDKKVNVTKHNIREFSDFGKFFNEKKFLKLINGNGTINEAGE